MKSSKEISILLLVAMGLTLLPAPLEAACDMTSHPDLDPCGTFPAANCDDPPCNTEPDHGHDNCCDADCRHCGLPCCSGTAMIPPVAHVLDAALTADGRLVTTTVDVTRVDADPLYHPPRG